MTSNDRRSRLRLIRRQHRKREGLPLRRNFSSPRPRSMDEMAEERDLDTPDPALLGITDDL